MTAFSALAGNDTTSQPEILISMTETGHCSPVPFFGVVPSVTTIWPMFTELALDGSSVPSKLLIQTEKKNCVQPSQTFWFSSHSTIKVISRPFLLPREEQKTSLATMGRGREESEIPARIFPPAVNRDKGRRGSKGRKTGPNHIKWGD